jgi:hypothetical protein
MATKNELMLENEALRTEVAALKEQLARETALRKFDNNTADIERKAIVEQLQVYQDAADKAKPKVKKVFTPRAPTAAECAVNDAWRVKMNAARELAMSSGKSVLV